MAYGNQYNQNPQYTRKSAGYSRNNNADSVTTNGVFMHNERAGKFLRIRYWSRTLSMDIGVYPAGTPLDMNVIQNAQTFNQNITFSTIFELKEICDEVLDSIQSTGRFTPTATVATQKGDSIVEISDGSNLNLSSGIYLVLYKNVDAGKRSGTFEVYPFSSTKVMKNYNHNTGAATEDIKATGDFKKFAKCLDEAAKAFTMAQAHAIAEVKKSDKTATFMALSAIAANLGVDISKAVNESQRTSGSSSYGGQKPSGGGQGYQRRSQPGQWNRSGNGGYNPNSRYQTPQQQQLAEMANAPVDINIDAATLQNVSMDDFT